MKEYHRERIISLLEQEMCDAYRGVNYLRVWQSCGFRPVESTSSSSERQRTFSIMDRRRIGEWFYGATDFMDVPRYIGTLAMKYFDTVLARRYQGIRSRPNHTPSQDELQVLAVASIYLAIKLSWSEHGWNAERMCKLAAGAFSAGRLLLEEKSILETLEWRMHPPLANDFFHAFVSICETTKATSSERKEIEQNAYYLMELAVLDYYFIDKGIPPSYVALAALANSICMVQSFEHYSEPYFSIMTTFNIVMDQSRYHLCCRRLWDLYALTTASSKPEETPRTPSPSSVTHLHRNRSTAKCSEDEDFTTSP